MSEYHQFPACVDLAVVPVEGDQDVAITHPRGTPLSDRARPVVSRIGRNHLEMRDALWAVLDAMAGVERTVDWMRATLQLRDRGVQIAPELVVISADGIQLHRSGAWEHQQSVRVYLVIAVRDVQHFLPLQATVQQTDGGAFLAFRDLRGDERDLLVAFVFQQEAKERRRALANPG